MNFKEMGLGGRLRYARELRGISQQQLADLVPMTQPALHNTENGRNKGTSKLVEISIALDVNPIWLQTGDGPITFTPPNTERTANNGEVPLISWVAAGNWSAMDCRDIENVVEKWMPCPVKHSNSTYALTVRGESMRNIHSDISFNDGDIIYVDTQVEPEHKSCVIAYLEEGKEVTFKQLIIDETGKKFLQPLNPSWPSIIEINGNASIIGVIIGKWVKM